MISLPTYILLVYLTGGGMRVTVAPDLWSCIKHSQFEVRFDPGVRNTLCVPHEGSWA